MAGVLNNSFLRYRDHILRVAAAAIFVSGWWFTSLFYPKSVLPGPLFVAVETYEVIVYRDFFYNLYFTGFRVIGGFTAGFVLSTVIGISMGISEDSETFFEPYILSGLMVPGLAVLMIIYMMLGLRDTAAIISIGVVTFPVMTQNIWQGTKDMDTSLLKMGQVFQFGRRRMLTEVILPQLTPYILASTRFGLAISWKVVIIAELLGLSNGVGYRINQSFSRFQLEGVIAWTIAFLLVMVVVEWGIIKQVEERLTRWRPEEVRAVMLNA